MLTLYRINLTLKNFGKVVTIRPNLRGDEEGFSALLVTKRSAKFKIKGISDRPLRPNCKGALVGEAQFDNKAAIGISELIESATKQDFNITHPVFEEGGEKLLREGRQFFQANQIDTFLTWEQNCGFLRYYVASVKTGTLMCDGLGRYSTETLASVDWTRHGLVFVYPGQYPLRLNRSLH